MKPSLLSDQDYKNTLLIYTHLLASCLVLLLDVDMTINGTRIWLPNYPSTNVNFYSNYMANPEI